MAPWDRRTNIGSLRSAPGINHYHAFTVVHDEHQECHKHERVSYKAHVIVDDHTETSGNHSQVDHGQAQSLEGEGDNDPLLYTKKMKKKSHTSLMRSKLQPSSLMMKSERLATFNPQAELLRWHYRLEHTSFTKLKLMTALGILPRKPSKVHPPKCAGCIFGAMNKKPWRTKATTSKVKPLFGED
jgi:hypothetical protein